VGYFAFPAILRKYWHRDGPSRRSIMAFGLCVCFVYAWFGTLFGLVPIVGAFFAGLLLEDPSDHMGKLIEPIVEFLAPLFFVLIGAQVRLDALAGMGWRGLGQIALLLVLAVAGKVACGAAAAGTARERLAVGVGMIPRGEVGLVFVVAGRQAGVVSDELFGVLVFVILISTILPGLAFHRIMGRVARARA
jgi:Kef-type K+ transport system membrane component KefB